VYEVTLSDIKQIVIKSVFITLISIPKPQLIRWVRICVPV